MRELRSRAPNAEEGCVKGQVPFSAASIPLLGTPQDRQTAGWEAWPMALLGSRLLQGSLESAMLTQLLILLLALWTLTGLP